MNERLLSVEHSMKRLDVWLADQLPEHSRSAIRRLFDQELVSVDGAIVKPSFKARQGQVVRILIPDPEPIELIPEAIPLEIAYEDEWLLVVNKPQGMVVHPAAGHRQGTLAHALLAYLGDDLSTVSGVGRPGIVHRIDKDTSGLLLVVKDNETHRAIADQLRRRSIERIYETVVWGHPDALSGTIDAPIGRDPRNRKRMSVRSDGKPSRTHFNVLEQMRKATRLRVELETGRTHQIRVHMAYIGHPIVGDPLYAKGRPDKNLEGQALHARELRFIHPVTDKSVVVTSDLPTWFQCLLEKLHA